MWISRDKYDELHSKIQELQQQVYGLDERIRKSAEKEDDYDRLQLSYDDLEEELEELREEKASAEKQAEEAKAKLTTKEKLYDILSKCLEAQKKLTDDATAALKVREKSLEELRDSFNIVCRGMYCQDNIEFAAVKTYRGGWEFICHDGTELTDLNNAGCVRIYWDRGERVNVEVNR